VSGPSERTAANATIEITVNGERHEVPDRTTVAALLETLGTERRGVAVAVDGEVVARSAWSEHALGPGAHVEILSVARGG
jgi:sulfur carrier protein